MPSRSLSNSSDVSVASNNSTRSEDFGELLVSGQNTPALRGGEYNPLEDGIHDGRSKITGELLDASPHLLTAYLMVSALPASCPQAIDPADSLAT